MGVQHSSEETVEGVSLESADRSGSDHQGLELVSCFPDPRPRLGQEACGFTGVRRQARWETRSGKQDFWGPAFWESSLGRASGSSLTERGIGPQHLTRRRIGGISFLQG